MSEHATPASDPEPMTDAELDDYITLANQQIVEALEPVYDTEDGLKANRSKDA